MTLTRQDLIDSYLMGRLTPAERTQMEQDIAADKTLADDIAFTRRTQRALKSRGEKLQAMQQWDHERSHARRARLTRIASITSLAAILIIGVLVFQPTPQDDTLPLKQGIETGAIRGADSGTARVHALMQDARYAEALQCVDSLLDDLHRSLPDIQAATGEERTYMMKAYQTEEHDLQTLRETILKAMQ